MHAASVACTSEQASARQPCASSHASIPACLPVLPCRWARWPRQTAPGTAARQTCQAPTARAPPGCAARPAASAPAAAAHAGPPGPSSSLQNTGAEHMRRAKAFGGSRRGWCCGVCTQPRYTFLRSRHRARGLQVRQRTRQRSQAAQQRAVMLRRGQHQRAHQALHQLRLERRPLVGQHNVQHR